MKCRTVHISFLFMIFSIMMSSCVSGGYSFTGASIGEAETIRVDHFPNRASVVNPTLSNTFTEELKDKFIQQTDLSPNNGIADMEFEGEITGYRITPQAIQGNQTAAVNRLTVSVKVKFINRTDEEQNFETNFSAYSEYESSKSLSSVESELIDEIVDKLTEDIFNKAVVNW